VRQAGGELAERDQLLVVPVARGEMPDLVEHHVHQRRGELVAVADHLEEMLAAHRDELGGLDGDDVAQDPSQTRVGQHTSGFAGVPFLDLASPRAAIDVDRDLTRQHHVQAFDDRPLLVDDLAGGVLVEPAVGGQPRDLRGRHAAEHRLLRQAVDEVGRWSAHHGGIRSSGRRDGGGARAA
jgi:hypothetical protein